MELMPPKQERVWGQRNHIDESFERWRAYKLKKKDFLGVIAVDHRNE